eukprot:3900647-Pyramimonas_sp.AAC.2
MFSQGHVRPSDIEMRVTNTVGNTGDARQRNAGPTERRAYSAHASATRDGEPLAELQASFGASEMPGAPSTSKI